MALAARNPLVPELGGSRGEWQSDGGGKSENMQVGYMNACNCFLHVCACLCLCEP